MKTVVTVQDLITSAYSRWKNIEGPCDSRGEHSKLLIKADITSVKEVVVFRLLLFSVPDGRVIKNSYCKIKAITTTKVVMNGSTYKIISAIFHYGQDLEKGHYTSMFRGNTSSWTYVNDSSIENKT
jgi:Ubiquitin carboxyl-terminal hydrolase.